MKEAQVGDLVSVHYTGKLKNGEVFDSSKERNPLEFTLGSKELLAGFEDGVVGMKPGETKSVMLEPENCFTCGQCQMACPFDAITMVSIDMDI